MTVVRAGVQFCKLENSTAKFTFPCLALTMKTLITKAAQPNPKFKTVGTPSQNKHELCFCCQKRVFATACVCVTMKKSARRMASTSDMTSDTGDTSSKRQQAQRKQKYNKRKRPVSSVDTVILTGEKREAVTNPTHVAVYLFGTNIETGVDSKDDSGSQDQYRE